MCLQNRTSCQWQKRSNLLSHSKESDAESSTWTSVLLCHKQSNWPSSYHEDPSDHLITVPQVSVAVWLPKIIHDPCVPQRVLPSWLKLFSDMRFSLWTTQILENTACNLHTFKASHCVSFNCVLPGTCLWRRLCAHDSKWMKGHNFFSQVVYVVCEGSNQHTQAGWAAAGVHTVPLVCCQRRGGSVWTWLLCSDCTEHLSNISHGLDCFPGPRAWNYDEVASIFYLLFFSFPQNLSYRTCQKEKTVSFSVLKRHMGFSVSRRRNLTKTVFSYSPCHSWNLVLQCVCKDSTAVLWRK